MSKEIVNKAYNILAKEYYEARKFKTGSSYFFNENLEMPTTLKLLGSIKGKRILDLGCGPGLYASVLKQRGAIVKGIDASEELIKIAREEVKGVEFILGDAEKLPYRNNEFDIVLSALVLGHFDKWNKVLSEIRRVLKKNGVLVFSIHNPVTEKFVKKKWFFKKFKVLDGYFDEGLKNSTWAKDHKLSADIIHYHKTYGTIVKLLVNNGFEIIDYEDAKPLEKMRKLYEKHYNDTLNNPKFSVWKVRKR